MPLTETEIISVRMLLKLRSGMPNNSGASLVTTMLNRRISALSPAAVTAVQTILTQFSAVQFQSGELHGDYESSPQRQRDLLRRHLITVLDFDPADYGSTADSPYPRQLERGS
jgi:hypothetical protein